MLRLLGNDSYLEPYLTDTMYSRPCTETVSKRFNTNCTKHKSNDVNSNCLGFDDVTPLGIDIILRVAQQPLFQISYWRSLGTSDSFSSCTVHHRHILISRYVVHINFRRIKSRAAPLSLTKDLFELPHVYKNCFNDHFCW